MHRIRASRVWPIAPILAVIVLAGCRPHDFPQYPPNYREYAYVTNGGSNTVTVLDVVNVRVDRELAVGRNPVAVAASPTRNEIYVVNSGAEGANGSISVIDAEHNTVVATIPVRRQPVSIDLDATGNFAYVANSSSNSVSVVDLKARSEVAQIGAGEEPVAARISADGKTLVVANRRGNSATLIDPVSGQVRAVFRGLPRRNRPSDFAGFLKGVPAVLCGSSGYGDRIGPRRCTSRRAGPLGNADGRGPRAC